MLAFSTSVFATQFFATPSGAGTQDGTSWSNAYPQGQIQTGLNALTAGDTLNLGSGTYTLTALSISGSGTAGNPKTLLGVDTGTGLPVFQGTFNVNNSSNGTFINFPGAASHWTIKNLSFRNYGFVINLPQSGSTFTLRSNLVFENLSMDSIEDGIRIFNAESVVVKNCNVIRYTKKAFRIGDYTRFVTFESCSADCNGGDSSFPARAIPTGFFMEDTGGEAIIHDIDFIDCVARNNRFAQSSTAYWNGDGFSSERGTYNLTFIRCESYDNHDGGFDDKADDMMFQDCIAAGNMRAYRQWGTRVQMVNCIAAYNTKWGGVGGANGIWMSASAGTLHIDSSTIHDSGTLISGESGGSASAVVRDSILSTTSSSTAFTEGNVTLSNTTTYRPGSGTNPNYVAETSSWRGSPADAMDSITYGASRGYNSGRTSGSDTQVPTVPTGLAASSIGTTSFTLSWSAASDNVAVTGYEVFRNGVPYATPTSTSVSVPGLSPGVTYVMTVRATDAAGNSSAQSIALNVTTASQPVTLEGYYTGATSSGGQWTLLVRSDRTGTFFSSGGRGSFQRDFVIQPTGAFDIADRSGTTVNGRISADGSVSGTIGEAATFAGARTTAGHGAADPARDGIYSGWVIDSGVRAAAQVERGLVSIVIEEAGEHRAAVGAIDTAGAFVLSPADGASFAGAANAGRLNATVILPGVAGTRQLVLLRDGTDPARRLINISVRGVVGAGDAVLIPGFVVEGGALPVLVRGIGPGLIPFDVPADIVLQRPRIILRQGQTLVGGNTVWTTGGQTAEIVAANSLTFAFGLNPASADSALTLPLAAQAYTVEVNGADGGTGVALAEIYDARTSSDAGAGELINISGRGVVGTGDNILIGGFVVAGDAPALVLIRAAGPALTPFKVSGVLAQPRLRVVRGDVEIATAGSWSASGTAAAITEAAARTGAFAFPPGSEDSALLLFLPPHQSYTAQVSGAASTAGIALLEIYRVEGM